MTPAERLGLTLKAIREAQPYFFIGGHGILSGENLPLRGGSAMNAIKGIVQNGRVNLETPPDWPEGCAVLIEPLLDVPEKIGVRVAWRCGKPGRSNPLGWLQFLL
jgi:hypothetical protein